MTIIGMEKGISLQILQNEEAKCKLYKNDLILRKIKFTKLTKKEQKTHTVVYLQHKNTESDLKKNPSIHKVPVLDDFTGKFYPTFKELVLILYKLIKIREKGSILFCLFYEIKHNLNTKI